MSDIVLPIEKSSKEVSVIDYDFKVPYYPESNECRVSYKATPYVAGYDLYAAEATNILPKSNAIVSLDLRIAITRGVIDSGYRGIAHVLLFNHSDEVYSIKIGDRIAQVVFLEQFDVKFEIIQSADLLPKSVRNEGGFGFTGIWLVLANNDKKMAQKFDEETFEFLMKDNQIDDEKFKEFHKKMFNEMMEQAIFLACDILKQKRENDQV